MQYMAVEDLLKYRPAQRIDFGTGDPNPKHHTSNIALEMAWVLLLRKTFGNRLRRGVHTAFFSAVRHAKRIRDRIESRISPEPAAT